jgi:hypothetical protein
VEVVVNVRLLAADRTDEKVPTARGTWRRDCRSNMVIKLGVYMMALGNLLKSRSIGAVWG